MTADEMYAFSQNAEEAIEAGLRPCKRCRSDLLTYHPMKDIAEIIKQHLDELYERPILWNIETNDLDAVFAVSICGDADPGKDVI